DLLGGSLIDGFLIGDFAEDELFLENAGCCGLGSDVTELRREPLPVSFKRKLTQRSARFCCSERGSGDPSSASSSSAEYGDGIKDDNDDIMLLGLAEKGQ
ncbi:hypothetical protein BVRB_035220, partial [Beta vulgaris subsp. vulgaris]